MHHELIQAGQLTRQPTGAILGVLPADGRRFSNERQALSAGNVQNAPKGDPAVAAVVRPASGSVDKAGSNHVWRFVQRMMLSGVSVAAVTALRLQWSGRTISTIAHAWGIRLKKATDGQRHGTSSGKHRVIFLFHRH